MGNKFRSSGGNISYVSPILLPSSSMTVEFWAMNKGFAPILRSNLSLGLGVQHLDLVQKARSLRDWPCGS
jgi:hypothetical protein